MYSNSPASLDGVRTYVLRELDGSTDPVKAGFTGL
jgi:hypothetical protein